jgi:hypothetical protein
MLDNKILAIFDAKNYADSREIRDAKNKMLAYMTNLHTNFGALMFTNYPNWDDLGKSERMNKHLELLSVRYSIEGEELRKMAKNLAKLSWNELHESYEDIFSASQHIEKFENLQSGARLTI